MDLTNTQPNILIVEDQLTARQFLTRLVKAAFKDPVHIDEARDLSVARRILGMGRVAPARSYHLVLIDLQLPDGSGLELLNDLRNSPCLKIITTLMKDDNHIFPAMQLGADGYLLKDDPFQALVEALQNMCRREPPISARIARRILAYFRGSSGVHEPLSLETPLSPTKPIHSAHGSHIVHERLTPREVEVLILLTKGFTIKEISGLLQIGWYTVNDHIKSLYRKLQVASRAEAAVVASKQGWI